MTNRLNAIAAQIENGVGTVDVGTDHGYIPIFLAEHGYTGNIYACDINSGPLSTAKQAAREAGVFDRIAFSLSDGLESCPPDMVDTIVIAGMGGDLICDILDRAEWTMTPEYKMILQPMTKAEVLRYWLTNNDYSIIREEMAEDAGALYQILTVRFGKASRLTDAELFTGEAAIASVHPLFPKQLDSLEHRFKNALEGIYRSRIKNFGREEIYREILTQLREMKSNDHK